MHDFHVSKVSGANSVLDIYRIQPVHNWNGNRHGWFSSWIVYFIRYDISSQIFSVKNMIFKPNIFGGTPTFQKFYFRPNAEFSNQIFSATQGLFILFRLSEPRGFGISYF
jgi:hypothetical protein